MADFLVPTEEVDSNSNSNEPLETPQEILKKLSSSENNDLSQLIELVESTTTKTEEILNEFTKKLFSIIETEKFLPKLRSLQQSIKLIPTSELKNELFQILSNKGLSFYVTTDYTLEFYSAINMCPHDIHTLLPNVLCIYRSGILIYDKDIISDFVGSDSRLCDFFELLKQSTNETKSLISFAQDIRSLGDSKNVHALITFIVAHHSNLLSVDEFWEPIFKDIQYNFFQHETIKSLIFCKESSVPLNGFRLIKSSNDYFLRDYGIKTNSYLSKSHPGKRNNPRQITYEDIYTTTPPPSYSSRSQLPKRRKFSQDINAFVNSSNEARKDFIQQVCDWIKQSKISDPNSFSHYTPFFKQQIKDNCYHAVEKTLAAYLKNKSITNPSTFDLSLDEYITELADSTQKYIYFYKTNINHTFWCFISDRNDSPCTNIELRQKMEDDFHFICCFKPQ